MTLLTCSQTAYLSLESRDRAGRCFWSQKGGRRLVLRLYLIGDLWAGKAAVGRYTSTRSQIIILIFGQKQNNVVGAYRDCEADTMDILDILAIYCNSRACSELCRVPAIEADATL